MFSAGDHVVRAVGPVLLVPAGEVVAEVAAGRGVPPVVPQLAGYWQAGRRVNPQRQYHGDEAESTCTSRQHHGIKSLTDCRHCK